MTLWKALLRKLRRKKTRRSFRFDQGTIQLLESLARLERRSEEEVASELISRALEHRRANDQNLRHWKTLSPREQEVAALICLGYTNQQVANKLVISPETVKTHLRNLLRKFGLRHKSELLREMAGWDFAAWDR